MRPNRLPLFCVALLAAIFFFASLNRFDDWTLEQMPVRFVATAFAAGIAFVFVVGKFPLLLQIRTQAIIFWAVAVLLRLLALPLTPGDELWRYQWEGKVQQAGFNPYVHGPDDSQLEQLRDDFPAWYKI